MEGKDDKGEYEDMDEQKKMGPGTDLPSIMAAMASTLERIESRLPAAAAEPAMPPPEAAAPPIDNIQKTTLTEEGATGAGTSSVENPQDTSPPVSGTDANKGEQTGTVASTITVENLNKETLEFAKQLVRRDMDLEAKEKQLQAKETELLELKKSMASAVVDNGNPAAVRSQPAPLPGGVEKPLAALGQGSQNIAELRKEADVRLFENNEDVPLKELWGLRPSQGGVM